LAYLEENANENVMFVC